MRMRNVLLTSAASAGLLLAASSLPSAHAQKGTFLSPASQWAVTKVDGNGSSDQPEYCAVAKRYEDNAIMTIARNQSSETSFALDLQKPVFNQAQQLWVTLDPGAGEQREFSISPVSSQAFVVRLGNDDVFFDAIDRTGILRVEAADQFYVFNVADIELGETKLTSCLTASAAKPSVAAAPQSTPVPFPAKMASSSNQEFIETLNTRIQSLETQNVTLKHEISKIEESGLAVAQAPSTASASPEVEKLRAENLRLKASLQTGEIAEQSERIRILEEENRRLAAEANSQSGVSSRVVELQERIEELLEDNQSLQQRVSGEVGVDVSSYEADIRQLKLENSSLRKALSEQAENGDVSSDLHAQLQALETENRALREKSLLSEQAVRQEKMAEVQRVRDEYQEKVAALEVEVRALNARRASYESNEDEINQLQTQLLALRSENVALQEELINKKEALQLASVDGETLETLETRNSKLKDAVQKSLDAHNLQGRALKALEQENAALKTRVEDVVATASIVDELKLQLESAQAQLELDTKKREHQEQKLASLSTENETLKEQLQLSAVDGEALKLAQNDIDLLRQEIAAKDSTLVNLERSAEQGIAALEQEVAQKEAALKKVKHETKVSLAALEGKIASQENVLSKLGENSEANIAVLQKELAAKETELAELSKHSEMKIAGLQQELEAKSVELASLSESSQANIAALKEELAERDVTLAALNEASEGNVAALKEELAERDAKLAALSESSQKDIEQLKLQLASAQESLEGLGQESDLSLAALKEELIAKDAMIEALEKDTQTNIAALEAELTAKDEALEAMQAETQVDLAALQETLAEKDAQLSKYNAVPERLNKLLAAYKQSKEDKAKLEATLLASADENAQAVAEKAQANTALEQQLAEANTRNAMFEEKLEGLQKSVVAMAALNAEAKGLHLALAEKEQEIASLKVLQQDLQVAKADNNELKEEKETLVLALQEALSASEQKIGALEDARLEDAEMIAVLEQQKEALKERNQVVLAENSSLKGESEKLATSYEEMMAENDQRNAQQVEAVASQEDVKAENETLRAKLASVLDMFKRQENVLKDKQEQFGQVIAENEALRGQLDLASQVIASVGDVREEVPVRKVSSRSNTTQGSVILAAAEVPTPKKTPPRKESKPEPQDDGASVASIAEQLNAIMPAAGDEEEAVTAQADVIEAPDVIEDAQDFMERDLNQAQIYEEQLKRSLKNATRVEASQADAIDVEELASDPITAVIEEEAAKDTGVEMSPVTEDGSDPVTTVEISDDVMPAVEKAVERAEETVEVKMSQDPFEGIEAKEEGAEKAAEVLKDAPVVAGKESVPLPVKVKEPKSQPVNVAKIDAGSVARVLKVSGVDGVTRVKPVNKAGDAYQWRAGDLYGSGEQRKMSSPAQFDEFVTEYLTRTEERCDGDFAIVPDNSRDSGSMRVDSYEVACIGKDVSSSASLVFYNDGDVFTVLAHETKAEEMEQAMRVRDKIFNSLTSGRDS